MFKCRVSGCGRDTEARGLCGMHYQRFLMHGDASVVLPPGRPSMRRVCALPGCSARHRAHGYCEIHSKAFATHLSGALRGVDYSRRRTCAFKGCEDSEKLESGYCKFHDRAFGIFLDICASSYDKSCSYDGCDTHVYAYGLCRKHYRKEYIVPRQYIKTPGVKEAWYDLDGLA